MIELDEITFRNDIPSKSAENCLILGIDHTQRVNQRKVSLQ